LNEKPRSDYILTSRGRNLRTLIKTILTIDTTDQLEILLRNFESPSREISTDEVREELAQLSAKIQSQEALIKALFALCPKSNYAKGFEPKLTIYKR
jgi:hypothetical protein